MSDRLYDAHVSLRLVDAGLQEFQRCAPSDPHASAGVAPGGGAPLAPSGGLTPEEMQMSKPTKGDAQGAQHHAEGQQGDRTRGGQAEQRAQADAAAAELAHDGPRKANDPNRHGKEAAAAAAKHEAEHADPSMRDGKHRLMEGREQMDEGEKQSEKNRLSKDVDRHDHDRTEFQVPGGAGSAGTDDK